MKDVPTYTQNTFILYSAATGSSADALANGIEPKHIRQTCVVRSLTPMTVAGSGFDKSGLKITPVLANDGLTCTFELRITECDFFLSDSFTLTFATKGDADDSIEPAESTIKFKVICYGCDRPYLTNSFVEYNCARDPLVSRKHVVPVSVNGLASLHIHELNIEKSGIEVRDNDADEGENVVYYNWSPGNTGAFGIAVEGVTYEGNHGVGTVDSYPFPQGRGADVIVIANYPDYYAPGYTCALAPAGTVTMPEYALYGGVMEQYGGAFTLSGDVWEHKYEEYPSQNTVHHVDHRISASGSQWILQSASYLDNASADWVAIATAPMAKLTIPALDGDKQVTLEGTYTLPPFSGWSDSNMSVVGDGRYFTPEKRFFNTVNVSSIDGKFTEFPVYCGAGGVMYQTQQQGELTLFPEASGWQIASGGDVLSNVKPQETTQTAVTYAPPGLVDTTFTTDVVLSAVSSGATIEMPVVMALNNDLGGMLLTIAGNTGGTWNRYPYHRLVDPDLKISAVINMKAGTDGNYFSASTYRNNKWGEELSNVVVGKNILVENIEASYTESMTPTGDRGAELTITVPLDGGIKGAETVKSFAGLVKNPSVEATYTGADSSTVEKSAYGRMWKNNEWRNKDTMRNVTLGNGDVVSVPATSGFEELEESINIDSDYSQTVITSAHTEDAADGAKSGSGYVDCYLHIGQTDTTDGGRMTTQAASYGGTVSADIPVQVTDTNTVERDGEIIEDNSTSEKTTASVSVSAVMAEAYPRIALPGFIGSDNTPDKEAAKNDYSITIRAYKTTALTGGNWKYEVENTYICDGKYRVYWEDEDDPHGEGTEQFFPVKCYAPVGESSKTTNTIYKYTGGTASISYANGIATCSCSLSAIYDYHSTYTETYMETAEKYPDGTPGINTEYPVNKGGTQHRKSSTRQHITGNRTLKVEYIGDGKYRITRTFGPDGRYEYSHDTQKSEEENRATEVFEWVDHNGNVYGRDSEEGPPTITEVEEGVSLTPEAVRAMFDSFVDQLPQKGEEIESAPDDWQFGADGCDFTDSPLYAVSGAEGSSIIYEESSAEKRPAKISVSFVVDDK